MANTLLYELELLIWNTFVCCGCAQADGPRAILTAGQATIPVGSSVILSCSVEPSAEWKYNWFRWTTHTPKVQIERREQNSVINVTTGGFYQCEGVRETYSEFSNMATVKITFSNEVVMTQIPNWPQVFSGETVTLACEVKGGESTKWTYEWRRSGSLVRRTETKNLTFSVFESNSGDYRCLGLIKDDWYSSTEWSKPISLSVLGKPKAQLSVDSTEQLVGGSATLACSVNSSSSSSFSWKYFRQIENGSSQAVTTQEAVFLSNGSISVSEEGLYRCRGGRGEPVYNTNYSNHIRVRTPYHLGEVAVCSDVKQAETDIFLDAVYSLIERKNFGTDRTPQEPEELAVCSDTKKEPTDKSIDPVYSLIEGKNIRTDTSPQEPEKLAVCADMKKGATDIVYSLIQGKNIWKDRSRHDPE